MKPTTGQGGGPWPTDGRIQQKAPDFRRTPSCWIVVSDGIASVTGCGRTDNGSDDSTASPKIVEKAVINGIGSLKAIKPVKIEVALKAEENPKAFTFSSTG